MFKKIIEHTIHIISHDNKLVRFSFLISFFHSIYSIGMILYGFNNILIAKFDKGLDTNIVLKYLEGNLNTVIVVAIIGFICYQLIYPIGQAAIIHYLDNQKRSIGKAISLGIEKFFAMLEFNNILRLFSIITLITTLMRLVYLDIIGNVFVLILITIRGLCVFTVAFVRPYTKYALNLEGLSLNDAIKRSSKLALHNFGITAKFVILEGFLILRFFIGTIIILGVPLLILYIATQLNAGDAKLTSILTYGTGIILLLITTYINGLIEAFFATYRYKVYTHLLKTENGEEDDEYADESTISNHLPQY